MTSSEHSMRKLNLDECENHSADLMDSPSPTKTVREDPKSPMMDM